MLNPTTASLAQGQNASAQLAVTEGDTRGQINKLDPASPEVKVLEKKIETIAQIVALLRKLSAVNRTIERISSGQSASPVDLKVDVPALIKDVIEKTAAAGLSTRYALTSLGVESNFGRDTNLGTGKTYQGIYQFSQRSLNDALGRAGDLASIDDQIEAFVKNTQKNAAALKVRWPRYHRTSIFIWPTSRALPVVLHY